MIHLVRKKRLLNSMLLEIYLQNYCCGSAYTSYRGLRILVPCLLEAELDSEGGHKVFLMVTKLLITGVLQSSGWRYEGIQMLLPDLTSGD